MTADSAPSERRLPAGRVGRAHGLDGSFYVTRARPRLLTLGATVAIGSSPPTAIVRRAGTDERPIVRVEHVEDRDRAEALRGQELTVAAQDAPTLGEDEWWAHELEGCAVTDGQRRVGVVQRLIELPSCEALEVALEGDGGSGDDAPRQLLLVPLVKDAIRAVDATARRIDIDMRFLEG